MGTRAGGSNDAALPTVVEFEHPFFKKMEHGRFHLHRSTGEPVMNVMIASNEVLLPFPGLKLEFKLGKPDCAMLDLLGEGLKYVNGLQIGDSLPKEILTGEATWEPSPRHLMIAHQRVSMQLVNWLLGSDELVTDPEALIQLADDPANKRKVNEAFGEAAERLGIGRENREQMVGYVEKLSRELSYIECLRDKFGGIREVQQKVHGLRQVYKREASICQTIDQIIKLIEIAVKDFSRRFLELDAQTGEIISVLKNLENVVLYIRSGRDDLHVRLMAWEEIIKEWKHIPVAVSYQIGNILGRVYQFLAPRFMKVDEWTLMTKLQERKASVEELTKKKKALVW